MLIIIETGNWGWGSRIKIKMLVVFQITAKSNYKPVINLITITLYYKLAINTMHLWLWKVISKLSILNVKNGYSHFLYCFLNKSTSSGCRLHALSTVNVLQMCIKLIVVVLKLFFVFFSGGHNISYMLLHCQVIVSQGLFPLSGNATLKPTLNMSP